MTARPESGPMRFGDDWAGVFFRGDYAAPMGFYLSNLFDALDRGQRPSPDVTMALRGLMKTLGGCDERGGLEGLQQMRPFAECLDPEEQARRRQLDRIAADLAEMERIGAMTADDCEHDKVFSGDDLCSMPPQYPWICRKCKTQGVDRGATDDDGAEYDRLAREAAR